MNRLFLLLFTGLLLFQAQEQSFAQCNRGSLNFDISSPRCVGEEITFTNNTPDQGGDNFIVEIAGNNVSYGFTPTNAGDITITFRRENNEGSCINEYTADITVSEIPDATFTFDNENICSATAITFTPSQTGLTYLWDFGDGGTSTEEAPAHVFEAFGEGNEQFTVSLTVTNAAGCSETETDVITLNQRPNPRLQNEFFAEISSFSNCENAGNGNFAFDVELRDGTNETVTNYRVDWGDGSAVFEGATLPNSHTYNAQGVFEITIEATGTNGCVGTRVFDVYNIGNPALGLESPGNTVGQCGPVEFQFGVTGFNGNDESTIYNIDLGDGTPPYTLSHAELVADPFIVHEYGTSPCDTGEDGYTLRVEAVNGCGTTEATVRPISVNLAPVPAIGAPLVGCVGQAVTFIDNTVQGYSGNCQRATAFSWDFGDGETLQRGPDPQNVTKVYNTPGTYTILLTTSNPCGDRTTRHTIEITEPPVSSFTGGDDPGITSNTNIGSPSALAIADNCLPLSVDLQNLSTGNNITAYQWSVIGTSTGFQFGNNGEITTNVPSPTISFSEPGSYTVALTTVNPCGSSTSYASITINTPPQITEANIIGFETDFQLEGGVQQACAPVSLDLSTNLAIDPGVIDALAWEVVGINGTVDPAVPTANDTNDPGSIDLPIGSYMVRLRAGNACGDVTVEQEVLVQGAPESRVGDPQTICAGGTVTLGALNPEAGINYSWQSIDAGPVLQDNNQLNATATINAAGIYEFELTASGALGCALVERVSITVDPLPVVEAGVNLAFCISDAATALDGFSPVGGTWSGAGVDVNGIFDPATVGVGSHTVTYSFTDGQGCENTDTRTIVVSALPAIDAGENIAFCTGTETLQLTGFTPVGGTWSGTGVNANGLFDPTGLAEDDYILTYTFNNGICEVSDQITVTLGAPVVVDAGNDETVCAGSPLALVGTPAAAIWSVTNPLARIENNDTFISDTPGTYTLTLTDGTGSCTVEDTKTVTVNPAPSPQINDLVREICAMATMTLNAGNGNAANIETYEWEASNNGGLTNDIFSATDQESTSLNFPDLQSANAVIYEITLTLTSDNNCSTSITEEIVMHGRPQASFNIPIAACGSELLPENTASFATAYTWEVSGGNNDATIDDANAESPVISFPPNTTGNTVTYTLSLTAQNANGCSDFISQGFSVFPQPTLGFDIDVEEGCAPLSVNFTNTTDPGNGNDISTASFQWLINGVEEGNTQDFTFDFVNNTAEDLTYEVTLVATTLDGCVDSQVQEVTVFPNPIAELNPTVEASCAPFVIDRSVVVPEEYPQANDTYTWNFYDVDRTLLRTETGLDFNEFVIGTEDDSVIVELVTTNVHGCQVSRTEELFYTIPDPVAAFTFPEPLGCHPFSVDFTNTSSVGITSFEWFVDGVPASVEESPTLVFENEGPSELIDYTVDLIVTAGTGCKDTVSHTIQVKRLPELTLDIAEFCPEDAPEQLTFVANRAGSITWYSTELPNGALTADGIFDPVQAGVNGNGFKVYADFIEDGPEPRCTITDSVLVYVHPFPVPDFDTEDFYCNGTPVTFNNTTPAMNGYTIGYNWDFAGVGSSTEQNGSFTFNIGTDTVDILLTATTDKGCLASIEQPIFVTEPPLADFVRDFNPADTCGTLTVAFTDQSSFGWDYVWDFGTGETSTLTSPSVFLPPSTKQDTTYQINLKVSNGCGVDNANDFIKVKAFPVSEFLFSRDTICANSPLQINNFSVGSPDFYVWNYGDGTPQDTLVHDPNDNQPPIYHSFMYDGNTDTTFNVTLYTFNDCGIDSLTKPVVVIPNLVNAVFETTGGRRGCAPHTVTFTSVDFTSVRLSEANTLIWDFGQTGLERIGGTEYTITYNTPGDYVVQLVVENDCHRDVFTDTIRVFPNADPQFEILEDEVCFGEEITINHTSTDPFASQWTFGNGQTHNGLDPEPVLYADTGTYTISLMEVYVGENQTCDRTLSRTVRVVPYPVPDFTIPGNNICQGLPQQLANLTVGAQSYLWQIFDENGNVQSTSIDEEPIITINQAGLNTVTLYAFASENQEGCADSISRTINVLPKPALEPLVELNREVNCGVWTLEFENLIDYPFDDTEGDIQIDFGNGQILSGFEDTYVQDYVASDTGSNQVDIVITSTTAEGCTDTLTQTLTFESCCVPKIMLPENNNAFAFTPFNGGINELFKVKYEFVDEFEMEIYNREGQMVFMTNDKDEGWDGTYQGAQCETGLYQVVIRYAGCRSGRNIAAEPINIQLFLMD